MFGGRRISAESSKFLVRKYEQVNSCPPGEARESNPCGVTAADAYLPGITLRARKRRRSLVSRGSRTSYCRGPSGPSHWEGRREQRRDCFLGRLLRNERPSRPASC